MIDSTKEATRVKKDVDKYVFQIGFQFHRNSAWERRLDMVCMCMGRDPAISRFDDEDDEFGLSWHGEFIFRSLEKLEDAVARLRFLRGDYMYVSFKQGAKRVRYLHALTDTQTSEFMKGKRGGEEF